ncbi:flavin reductase family protein [Actinoplanes oblitus]|uniref:Flavin reductase family protein n=1 Tax=Actinoplanes oblitus TaxID=3040509 RepID=A0ABY8W6W8_9ACTN|nr:flavin reductase family protein [Actinoplanes oblitus]WIM93594.1 flavin reductase family protein [Actinoplanes oblitus]
MHRNLRDALGKFPTGVAVVTTVHDGLAVGLTINSFTSVSLVPPLVLWCLRRDSRCHAAFATTPRFAVNVLAAGQRELAERFAGPGDRFRGTASRPGPEGLPLLADVAAYLVCRTHRLIPAGDHVILIGEVLRHGMRPEPSLLFTAGRYGAADA